MIHLATQGDEVCHYEGGQSRVKWNKRGRTLRGWPARPAVRMVVQKDQLPVQAVAVEFFAKDQGWGNTGHSKVSLALHDDSGNLLWEKTLAHLNHHRSHFKFCVDRDTCPEFVNLIDAECEIALWAVSAPYPGFEAIVIDCNMDVAVTRHWLRRRNALLFLYGSGLLELRCNRERDGGCSKLDEDIRTEHPALHSVLSNDDLARVLITFI